MQQKSNEAVIQIPDKLLVLIPPKRFKIIIGGRGGGKSESVAALFGGMVQKSGCRAVCCREFQTSIKQSVHSLVSRKIKDYALGGFEILQTEIKHQNGGAIVYQGLARDPQAIKSIDDAELCWVEEAQSLSDESLEQLTPSIRGGGAEIWFTANLQASNDPFSKRFFKPYEKQLRETGVYEDELHTIVWINYDENPWFPDELEQERRLDLDRLSQAGYDHKWGGEPADTVEDAIIQPDWFDACVDAHTKLGLEPLGIEVVSHDPSDTGSDAKGLAYRHGVVFLDVQERDTGDINEGGDWATNYAHIIKPDLFIWDGDGMGVGLRRQFADAFKGKHTDLEMFRGSNSPDRPDKLADTDDDEEIDRKDRKQRKTNRQTYKNKRAQYYWDLRNRIYRTYQAVSKGQYMDPDKLISFSSNIENMALLRAEVCRIPLKHNTQGLIQIMTKEEMARMGIESPNMADSVMMNLANGPQKAQSKYVPPRRRRAVGKAGY